MTTDAKGMSFICAVNPVRLLNAIFWGCMVISFHFPFSWTPSLRRSKTNQGHISRGATVAWREEFCDSELHRWQLSRGHTLLLVQEDRGQQKSYSSVQPEAPHGVLRQTRHLLLHCQKWNKWSVVRANQAVSWQWVNSKLRVCCLFL